MILAFLRVLGLLPLVLLAAPALAHPHVWIEAGGEVLFEEGAVTGIRHHWTFDEFFSAWAVQGLDADGDGVLTPAELQPLAEENIDGLDYYSYYTFAGQGFSENFGFRGAVDPSMVHEDSRLTLSFTVLFDRPHRVSRPIEIEVGDPEYYVEFAFEGPDSVSLSGAPDDCAAEVSMPRPIDPAVEERLWSLGPEVTELPEDLREAVRDLSNVVTISCASGQAATALDAVDQMASLAPRRPPFAAPPVEPGIPTGQTGLLGWIGEQQRSFYTALTGALSALQDEWTAFWVLGGLSFLYGAFHAAGPGHGKVVISSYMLANERQLRRGIVLSFLAAMMQSAVAVGFVLVAAGLLRLTSMAMSEAANWMALVSYGLIAVLGAWLAARKILGHGHGHHRHHDHHHEHGEDCAHHVVDAKKAGGDWREGFGVVLAIGLRPCSGALVVLVFALAQGLILPGIAATFMMGIGTAVTVSVLACLAVGMKGGAMRLAGEGAMAAHVLWWVELSAALLVMAFGLLLLFAAM